MFELTFLMYVAEFWYLCTIFTIPVLVAAVVFNLLRSMNER